MEPEALSQLLMQPTLCPYVKHVIEPTFFHTLSPRPFLKFSSRIRLGILNSFFMFSTQTPCTFFFERLEACKIIIYTVLTAELGNLKLYIFWNNDDIGL